MGSVFMCQEITTSCSLLAGHCVPAHFAVDCLIVMKCVLNAISMMGSI